MHPASGRKFFFFIDGSGHGAWSGLLGEFDRFSALRFGFLHSVVGFSRSQALASF